MPTYVPHRRLLLRTHPEYTEKWLQERISEDPSLLGLGDLDVKDMERLQPRAGRLDMLETWGALHGDADDLEQDGDVLETLADEHDGSPPAKTRRPRRKVRVFGRDERGRAILTKDPDARVGWRTATKSRPAGPYCGYELFVAAQVPDVIWTDGVSRIRHSGTFQA